ncbi:MAG: two-component sensor histidine kinase [Hyphomicrobiales bacterium]|nr:MAG: two-component sensor histidine kinase [Hyphomicrobiales bacterium]
MKPDKARPRSAVARFFRRLKRYMPKGLYGRSLIIVVTPMIILQSVLVFVFLERHWSLVTQRMSEAVARDIAAIVELYELHPSDEDFAGLQKIALSKLRIRLDRLPEDALPPPAPKPFFTLLDRTLAREIRDIVRKPFWIDTVGNTNLIEVRILADDAVLRYFTKRSQAYASNSHIFLVWMVGTSLVLMLISILFLRNQIRPIKRLAEAAQRFGRGQSIENLPPAGAIEVRQASQALTEMGTRIERQIEQRTVMLAGVSHDLRTILTRFRLQLAMMSPSPDRSGLEHDVEDMERMLQDYMAFAGGSSREASSFVSLPDILQTVCERAKLENIPCTYTHKGPPTVEVRPLAFERCLGNLVGNACRYGNNVNITSVAELGQLSIAVEDDGPGIPPEARQDVFKPFFRLDEARNQDASGSGLGLSIAQDIALVHGGDILLEDSDMGGLRAVLRLPI